jgi:hypothetical protein
MGRMTRTFALLLMLTSTIAGITVAATARAELPRARLVDGASIEGRLAGIDAELNVKLLANERLRIVSPRELVAWGEYADVERGPQLVLADGSVIVADLLALDGPTFTIGDASGLGRVVWNESSLPLENVRGIMLQPPADPLARDRLFRQIVDYRGAEDQLLLVGGAMVAGTLVAVPPAGRFLPVEGPLPPEVFELSRRGEAEPLLVSAAKVAALQLAAPLAGGGKLLQPYLVLGFRDGSLLSVAGVRAAADKVEFALAGGGKLAAPLADWDDPAKTLWDSVTRVESRQPRVVFLSDLEPLGYKQIPFLTVELPYGQDQNVLGGRLRSGGKIALKGLGMPSASRLAYDLDDSFHRFAAELALDDQAGLGGSVVIKVLVEAEAGQWQTAYESPIIRGGDAPVPISLPLKNARRLALLVDFADRGDVCDYANLLHARLVK